MPRGRGRLGGLTWFLILLNAAVVFVVMGLTPQRGNFTYETGVPGARFAASRDWSQFAWWAVIASLLVSTGVYLLCRPLLMEEDRRVDAGPIERD